jgi:hypothetical protein
MNERHGSSTSSGSQPDTTTPQDPKATLKTYLEMLYAFVPVPQQYLYRGAPGFVLAHGVWHKPVPFPKWIPKGLPRSCFGNSITGAVMRGWKYIEGYALADCGEGMLFPTQHAWNLDGDGRLVDTTWLNRGVAYLGVEFSLARAFDAMYEGDGSVLDDWHREYEIFKHPWQGEDNSIPVSPKLQLLLDGKVDEFFDEEEIWTNTKSSS